MRANCSASRFNRNDCDRAAPSGVRYFTCQLTAPVRSDIRPLDVGCWLGRVFLCDSDGASVLWYTDAEHTRWRADRAGFEWGLAGFALWALGQEAVRLWEYMQGGELPQSAVV